MTRPRNHTIERVNDEPLFLKATWDFTDSEFSGTNRNFQVMCNPMYRPPDGYRAYTVPSYDGCWSDSDPQRRDEGYVIDSGYFYPNTDRVLTHVEHHVQMQGHGSWDDGYTDVVTFRYAEPLPPTVKITRDGLKLSWEVDARLSEMPDTSAYYRTKTKYWIQSRTEGEDWKNIPRYGSENLPSDGEFEGDKSSISRAVVTNLVPKKPIMFRVVAMNYGPSGCSEYGYSDPHVYGRVPTATVNSTEISSDIIQFTASLNNNEFRVVDSVMLERGETSNDQPPSSWSKATEEKRDDLASQITLSDSDSARFPAEDKAMWYRIKTYHDDSTANVAYGMPVNGPILGGKPKAPSEVVVFEGETTTVQWKQNSGCNPKYKICLFVVKNDDTVTQYTHTVDTDTQQTTTHYVFLEADTRSESAPSVSNNIKMVYATVQAIKDWGGLAGTVLSDVAKSDEAIIPSIDEIRLLEDGLSLYVSESHIYDGWDSTEYSWHTREDGWESTKKPETYTVTDSTTSSHVTIVDLSDGVQYYVRCRRYNSKTKAYGLYSSIVNSMTGSTPGIPELNARSSVAAGKGVEYTWDFRGGEQTKAVLSIRQIIERDDSYIADGSTDTFELTFDPGYDLIDRFTGNGTDTAFTLTDEPKADPIVTVNGEATSDFTLSENVLTFTQAPASGASIEVSYRALDGDISATINGEAAQISSVNGQTVELATTPGSESVTDNFTGNGEQTSFDLTGEPRTTPTITIDGSAVDPNDFTILASSVIFDTAPAENAAIVVTYHRYDTVVISYMAESSSVDRQIEGSEQGYVYETDPGWIGRLVATVTVTCGGRWSEVSESVITELKQPPTCSISPAGTITQGDYYRGNVLTALPLTVNLGGSGDTWELVLKTANTTNEPTPAGSNIVQAGSTVYTVKSKESGLFDVISSTGVIATGGQYDLKCTCIDSTTGSRSETKVIGFTANWTNKAIEPDISVEIVDGEAKVTAKRGTGDTGSQLSIWRQTSDGAILCVENAGDEIVYTDKVPPYQWDLSCYIAQVTTVDGDICWVKAEYSLKGNGLTIDFNDRQVVLPFNIEFKDKYRNKFESRAHMDGARAGYFEPGVDRTGTVTGQIPVEGFEDTVMLLRQLGRYSGIAFARDVRGVAFPCHADVDVSAAYNGVVRDIDISLTEIDDDGTWNMTSGAVPKPEPEEQEGI